MIYKYNPLANAFDIDSSRILGAKYVRVTRFAQISTGTAGQITIPTNNQIILDDFGGTVDAILAKIEGGKPILESPQTAFGDIVAVEFDADGNYTLSALPSNFPIALIYRTKTKLRYYDDGAADVIGSLIEDQRNENLFHGVISLPTLTDNGNGTVTLASNGVFNFYRDAQGRTECARYAAVGRTLTLTDNSVNYVYADYNNGAPVYVLTLAPASFTTDARTCPCYRIIRDGNFLHTIDYDSYGLTLPEKSFFKDVTLHAQERQSGLVLSTAPTRIATVSAGTAWFGVQLFNLAANIQGSAGTCMEWYLVAGVWTKSLITSYDSTYASTATNRVLLTGTQWVAKYFFRGVENQNHVYMVHGGAKANATQALNEEIPVLPQIITAHAMYVGKIVIQRNATNGTAYPRDWNAAVLGGAVVNHDDLANINQAAAGVVNGHVNDAAQTIAGAKTFSTSIKASAFFSSDNTEGSTGSIPLAIGRTLVFKNGLFVGYVDA
jgi:hypothetical protein